MLPQLLRLQPGARACKCITCITRSAIAKSSATPSITSKSSNRHTILFYSTIISTAAAADVTVKQNRRAEWDRKIEELEQSLQTDEEDAFIDEIYSPITAEVIPWSIARGDRKPLSELPNFIRPTNVDTKAGQIEALTGFVQEESGSPTRSNTTPWSIYASERVRSLRREWTPKKAVTVEYAVAKLVSRIMLAAPDITPERKAALLHTIDDLQVKLDGVKELGPFQIGNLERPTYPQYDPASQTNEDGTRRLNQVLLRLFQKCQDHTISVNQMLTKAAYNLLVSPVAPDTITFSELISNFSRHQCVHEADMAIEALEETHLRHDEMSVDTILTHYIRYRNLEGFHRYVLKVQGYYGGLQLAHPNTVLHETSPGRLQEWNGKIIESVNLDARLYNTILSGYSKFSYLGSARQWSKAMSRANVPQDVPVLLGPLSICAHTNNWRPGLRIWQHIEALLSSPETAFQIRRGDQRGAYYLMLKLCRNTSRHDRFKLMYRDALLQGFSMNELFRNIDDITLPARLSDTSDTRRRVISVLMRRVESIQQDMRELAVQLLAHKVLCAGLSLDAVKEVFSESGMGRLYTAWAAGRPWLAEAKTWVNPMPSAFLRKPHAESTTIELLSSGVVNHKTNRLKHQLQVGFKHVFHRMPENLLYIRQRKEQKRLRQSRRNYIRKEKKRLRRSRTIDHHASEAERVTSESTTPYPLDLVPSCSTETIQGPSIPDSAPPLIRAYHNASAMPVAALSPAKVASPPASHAHLSPVLAKDGKPQSFKNHPAEKYILLKDLTRKKMLSSPKKASNQNEDSSSWPDEFSKSLAVG